MRTMIISAGVALFALLGSAVAAAEETICQKIEKSPEGHIVLQSVERTAGCTLTLSRDTVIESPPGGSKIEGMRDGLVIKLDGHSFRMNGVTLVYAGSYALAIHGRDHDREVVTLLNTTLVNAAPTQCGPRAAGRVGLILYNVASATAQVTLQNPFVRWAAVVGAHAGPAPGGLTVLSGTLKACDDAAPFVFHRSATLDGKPLVAGTVGPNDPDPVKRNLFLTGLP